MLLSADMLCLVQSFQQKKLLSNPVAAKEKSSKPRKLPFIKRKKLQSVSCSTEKLRDDKLLQPESSGNNNLYWKDKQGLKHLSGSAPSVTCPPLSSSSYVFPLTPTTCLSRQKKFQRHFDVHPEERVIDYFSCALVADILLQGHLYISKNYFAFYSNVFGYVTKLLIPISTVTTVTKEKTAFILPNAVAVVTADDRHVFSSLLSRDTTYRLMVQVWKEALASVVVDNKVPETSPDKPRCRSVAVRRKPDPDIEDSLCEEPLSFSEPTLKTQTSSDEAPSKICTKHPTNDNEKGAKVSRLTQSTVLLAASTMLLVLLFVSAAVLMYRISMLHHHLRASPSPSSHRSLQEVQEFLDLNLQKLHKVRQSLEVLSLLMENEKEHLKIPLNTHRDNVLLEAPIEETEEVQIKEQTS